MSSNYILMVLLISGANRAAQDLFTHECCAVCHGGQKYSYPHINSLKFNLIFLVLKLEADSVVVQLNSTHLNSCFQDNHNVYLHYILHVFAQSVLHICRPFKVMKRKLNQLKLSLSPPPPPSTLPAQGCVPRPSGHHVLEVRPAHHLPHRPAAGQGGRDA